MPFSKPKTYRGLTLCFFLLTLLGIIYNSHRLSHRLKPRPFIIDEQTYFLGAKKMLTRNELLLPASRYHSVGMQIVLRLLMGATGWKTKAPFLILSFSLWLLWLGLSYLVLVKLQLRGPFLWMGMALHSLYPGVAKYGTFIQYEIYVCVLLTWTTYLSLKSPSMPRQFFTGLALGALSLIRVHFTLFLPLFLLLAHFRFPKGIRGVAASYVLLGFIALSLPINGYISYRIGRPFFSQGNFTKTVLLQDINAISTGENHPYTPKDPFRAVDYVLARPNLYFSLLEKRFSYFLGIRREVLGTPLHIKKLVAMGLEEETARILSAILWGLVFLGGVFCLIKQIWNHRINRGAVALFFAPLVVSLPIVFINYSTRFLVPSLPAILTFQILFLSKLLTLAQRYWESLKWHPLSGSPGFFNSSKQH